MNMVSNKPLSSWTLAQWLDYLENTSPAHKIQLSLERISLVAQKLNIHVPDCPVITVAGTNGKGSTVCALETIYHYAGYKVGSYTSPHLMSFNERIKTNLMPIGDNELSALFHLIESARDTIDLTYFEIATLAALLYFKQKHVDIIILEVGLGGRLDATNIINADVAIITSIDYDHQEYLGNTLEEIGYEKAGILRSQKPFIYADSNPPKTILKKAEELNSPAYLYSKEFSFYENKDNSWAYVDEIQTLKSLNKPLIHLKAAAAAIKACVLLEHRLAVPLDAIAQAMHTIYIPGRLQFTRFNGINVLYDVSHNVQSAQLLAQTIKQFNSRKKVHAVFSALKDKDILHLIIALRDCIDYWYLAQLDNIRAASMEYLLSVAKEAEIVANICYTSPLIAFKEALTHAAHGDLIVVFGSFFTVGQVMSSYHKPFAEKEII